MEALKKSADEMLQKKPPKLLKSLFPNFDISMSQNLK
jgi:hypothetical protein